MTRSCGILINILLLLFILSNCSKPMEGPAGGSAATSETSPQRSKISSEAVVRATAEPVEIRAGESAEATVRVSIQPGFHLNANPPTYSYLKATELDISNTDEISTAYISYPDPVSRKFSFAEKSLRVYEGEVLLRISLRAAKSATKGKRSLSAKLRVQACDDQVCYPPGSIEVALPVLIR